MSRPASGHDDTTDSEDGVCTSPNSSLFSDERGHGGSSPTPIRRVIAETGEDGTTKRTVSEDDKIGVCAPAEDFNVPFVKENMVGTSRAHSGIDPRPSREDGGDLVVKESTQKALTILQQRKFIKQHRKAAWEVPTEIFIEIVSWLPTSSVLRFKTVSKYWNDMITDPILADMHLSRGYVFGRPLVLLEISDAKGICLDLMAVEGGSSKRIVERIEDCVRLSKRSLNIMAIGGGGSERIAEGTEGCVHVSASSQGLICLYTAMEMVVFNPATGERLQLPEPTLSAGLSECYVGYHPVSRQLTVARFYDPKAGHFEYMETYHRERSTWSHVKADFYRDLNTGSVTVGGNMFFLGCGGGNGEEYRVVAFDISNEGIKDVKYPWSTTTSTVWALSNYDGNACVTVWSYDGTDIWVLQDVTEGSWSMMHRLSQRDFFLFPPKLAFHQERFLLKVARNLRLRNLATGKSRLVYARVDCLAAQFLRPSLVRLLNS